MLGGDPQRRSARDDQLRPRGQQRVELPGRVEQLLEVVDHDERLDADQRLELGTDELGRVEAGERHEPCAVGEVRCEPVRDFEREPRLADPARPGQREQARLGEQGDRCVEILVATEQWASRLGEWRGHGGGPRRRRRCVGLECGIVSQDLRLQPLQRRARIEAEILDERVARAPVRVERVRLASGAVQGQHQLRVQALAIRVLGRQRLQLRDERPGPPELQIELNPSLERRQPQLREPVGLRRGRPVQRRVDERWAAKQRQRVA